MAKVGEGDDRWIVSDRADGTNVNEWHWQERDLSDESHAALKAALTGLDLGGASLRITDVIDVAGDVTVAKRKGRMICYFDVNLKLRYAGANQVSGTMTIPEVEHDSFTDDFDIIIEAGEGPTNKAAAVFIQRDGRAAVRHEIQAHFQSVFSTYGVGGGSPRKARPAKQRATVAASSSSTRVAVLCLLTVGAAAAAAAWRYVY
jgi:activator of HSP90 ATPase